MIAPRRPVTGTRNGFTLVELLVVISILAILAALIGAGAQRMRVAGQRQATQDIVSKLQVGLDNQADALISQVRKDRKNRTPEFAQMTTFAGGDQDLAEALMVYARLRQNFPQTRDELAPFSIGGVAFPVPRSFATLAAANLPRPTTAAEEAIQSSVLMYAALASREYGGLGFASDEATAGAQVEQQFGTTTARFYKDAFGQPVGFRRFGTNVEMQFAPYTNVKDNRKDPFDPLARITAWAGQANPQALQQALVVFYDPSRYQGAFASGADAVRFDSTNRLPAAYSAGVNRAYENFAGDDILGYRLRQLGSKGTKQ